MTFPMHDASLAPARFEQGRPMLIAGLGEPIAYDRRAAIPKIWERFAPYIGTVSNQIGAAAFGAISFREGGFDYLAGVHVWDGDSLPKDFRLLRVPARRYAVFAHEGHVTSLPGTTQRIVHDWLPRSGEALGEAPQMVEVYGERFNLSAGAGDIEVWVALAD